VEASAPWEEAQLDCPPHVREFFGARLAEMDQTVPHEAHGRLYDHFRFAGLPVEFQEPVAYGVLGFCSAFPAFKDQLVRALRAGQIPQGWEKELPASVNRSSANQLRAAAALIDTPAWTEAQARFLPSDEAGMTRLFTAIRHGCQAGREDEAFHEVYWPRVRRGNKEFATSRLGLYGQELAALASFFQEPFTEPSRNLSPARRALLLNEAANRLRALGRLEDAVEPLRRSVQLRTKQRISKGAAVGASNLSELLVSLGRLDGPDGAIAVAADSVSDADRSGRCLSAPV